MSTPQECSVHSTGMVSRHWTSRRCTPPKISMRWKPACRGSQKRGACEPALCAEAGTLAGYRGRAGNLGEPAHAGHPHARLGALGRTHPGGKPDTRRRGGEQCDGGKTAGCLARTDGAVPDQRDPFRAGAGVPQRVLTGALQPASAPGAVLRPQGLSAHRTPRWSAAFAASKRSIAASAVARTGTRICCATGAALPTPPGGSKMQSIASS